MCIIVFGIERELKRTIYFIPRTYRGGEKGKLVGLQGGYRVGHVITFRVTTLGGVTLEPRFTSQT